MKLLHTSDWHLGMTAGIKTLEEEQRYFFKQLYEIIEREQIDVVLVAGDIYDSSVSNADAIALYNEVTTKICMEMGRKMVVIAGNHDGAARLASCRELLKEAGLYVTGRLTKEITPVVFDNAAIYPIPFFNREEVSALFPELKREITSQEKAMQIVCQNIKDTMDNQKRNIIVSHSLIVNAELSESDRSARVGFATAVSKDVLEGFDYVALGHIHKPQKITEQIRYSGSPVKYSFGAEEKQEKLVYVIDTDSMEITDIPLKQLREWNTIEGTYEEIMAMADLENTYLRLKITDRYAGLELLSQLQQKFSFLLELYGKGLEEQNDGSALTIDEIQTMDEMDIMKKFFAENFSYEPSASQMELFRQTLTASEREGELS